MNRRWLLGVPLLSALVACQIIAGLEEPQGVMPPVEEGDGGTDEDASADPCKHAKVPAAPAKDDDLDTKKDYWFAATQVELPIKQAIPLRGYDLDKACTCASDLHGGKPSCNLKGSAKGICDLDGGIDDAFAGAFGDALQTFKQADIAQPVNDDLGKGGRTLLLFVGDYNGKANDSAVKVQFVSSGGLYDYRGCAAANEAHDITYTHQNNDPHTPPGKDRLRPNNDGCDRWSPDEKKLEGGKPGLLVDGYVRDHQLVVTVPEVAAAVFGTRASLLDTITVATIAEEGNHFRLDGLIGARMPYNDLLKVIGGNEVNGGGDGGGSAVCDNPLLWGLAITKICGARDVMATKSEDFQNRDCDAVSLNMGFSMVQALVSDFEYTNPLTNQECPDVTCP